MRHYSCSNDAYDQEDCLAADGHCPTDASAGRFVSRDPLPGYAHDPQSLNGYVYVQNLPTVLKDPTGMNVLNCGVDGCDDPSSRSSNGNAGGGATSTSGSAPPPPPLNEIQDTLPDIQGVSDASTGGTTSSTATIADTNPTSATTEGQDQSSLFSDANFRDAETQQDHLIRHGGEFEPKYTSAEEYQQGRSLLERGYAGEAKLYVQGSGTKVFAVEPSTGIYVAYQPTENRILTYMVNPGGWDWVLNQIRWQGWWPFPLD